MEEPQEVNQQSSGEGGSHVMSIGYFVGGIIAIFGLILVLYGVFGPAEQSDKAGFNINLIWGLVMLVVGLLGLLWSRFSRSRPVTDRGDGGGSGADG